MTVLDPKIFKAYDVRGLYRTELDEENLGDFGGAAGHAANHSLTQPGIESAAEHHQIGDTRRLDGDNGSDGRSGMGER